jgi:hypothetical protein
LSQEGKSKASEEEEEIDDLTDAEDSQKPLKTTFELNDTLFAEAELEDSDTVFLWLGVRFSTLISRLNVSFYNLKANVMLSYKIPAAVILLKSKLEVAQTSLDNTIEDLEFLREQLTIMEVNTARVYNWDVKRRRELREAEAARAGSIDK